MTMTSNDLQVDFAAPLRFIDSALADKNRICINLSWVESAELIKHFKLEPKPEVDQGLIWLEGQIELGSLLEYHGQNLSAAAEKFADLADQLEWRQEHNGSGYLDAQALEALEALYQELQSGNQPVTITLAFIEHY